MVVTSLAKGGKVNMEEDLAVEHNKSHYDEVTDAWGFILGEDLHWGYFQNDHEELSKATDNLIDALADLGTINRDTRVLDVGCGTGGPAFYLHSRYGCSVVGISTSDRGIQIACDESIRKGVNQTVTFLVANALQNGLPADSFDLTWVMESSHLMRDKATLFSECARVLRSGGTFLLCDLILKKSLSIKDLFTFRKELMVLESVFGKAKMESLEFYAEGLGSQGFENVRTFDVSNKAVPTLPHWRNNLTRNLDSILKCISAEQVSQFQSSIDVLNDFFTSGVLGYGMVSATKI